MKTLKKIIHYTAPVLLTALAFTSASAIAAVRNLPLNITLETREILNFPDPTNSPCTAGELAGMTTGSGSMTIGYKKRGYSGTVTVRATDCATADFKFSKGKMVITAVNGSTLTADYSGSFSMVTAPNLIMNNNAKFVITGGTGVFDGATGGGDLGGTINVTGAAPDGTTELPGTLTGNGTISFSRSAFENAYAVY